MSKSKEDKVFATGFKGFGPGMVCQPNSSPAKQYQENTVFEEVGGEICGKGEMHFCENPFDTLNYYPLINNDGTPNEYAPVEALAPAQKREDKSCASKIKIGAKLSLAGFCKASFDYLHKICSVEPGNSSQQSQSGNYSKQSQSGYSSQQSQSGNYSKQSQSGYSSQQSQSGNSSQQSQSGNYSKQSQSGDYSKQSQSGNSSQQSQSGNYSQQSQSGYSSQQSQSGNSSQQSQSGNYSKQSQSGYSSQQSQSGDYSRQASVGNGSSCIATGNNCLVAALGKSGKVRGKKGCLLILVNYDENDAPIKTISGLVDGKKIKEDTWYGIENGKLSEV